MIDIVVNKEGMLSIVHDDKRLDAAMGLEYHKATRDIHVLFPDNKRIYLGRMTEYLEELFDGKPGYIVRMDGWVIREARKLPLTMVD